jgi:hypothetical protein
MFLELEQVLMDPKVYNQPSIGLKLAGNGAPGKWGKTLFPVRVAHNLYSSFLPHLTRSCSRAQRTHKLFKETVRERPTKQKAVWNSKFQIPPKLLVIRTLANSILKWDGRAVPNVPQLAGLVGFGRGCRFDELNCGNTNRVSPIAPPAPFSKQSSLTRRRSE